MLAFNGNSGRYRHAVSVLEPSTDTDVTGVLLAPSELFKKRCEVDVKSGSQLAEYDTALTSEIITVLMRVDSRIKNDHLVGWNGKVYEIQHIKPDRINRQMVLTCEVKTK